MSDRNLELVRTLVQIELSQHFTTLPVGVTPFGHSLDLAAYQGNSKVELRNLMHEPSQFRFARLECMGVYELYCNDSPIGDATRIRGTQQP